MGIGSYHREGRGLGPHSRLVEELMKVEGKAVRMQCAGLQIYRDFFLRPGGSIGLAFRLLHSRVQVALRRQQQQQQQQEEEEEKEHDYPKLATATELLRPWPTSRMEPPPLPAFCNE